MTGAAWHADPTGRHELRWWDGSAWTDHVSDHGIAGHDPLVAPAAPTVPQPTVQPTVQQPTMQQPTVQPGWPQQPVAQQAWPQQPAAVAPAGTPFAPVAPSGGRRTPWVWLAVAAVAAIGIGAGVVVTMRGDDANTSTEATAETEEDDADTEATIAATTVAPGTTVAVTTAPATLPATTVPPTAASTTAAPTTLPPTAPPTTLPHVATAADLAAALPPATEAPAGWTPTDQAPTLDPAPSTSPGAGFCGGMDGVARGRAHGATAIVWSAEYDTLPYGTAGVDLLAFPTEADASAFLADTLAATQTCAGTWTYTELEGEGDGQFDGFEDPYGDGVVVWTFIDQVTAATVAAADTPEAVDATYTERYSTVDGGTEYGGTFTQAIHYERHGRVVEVVWSGGECCNVGYSGIDPSQDTVPTLAEVAAAADGFRPGLVARLTASGAI